MSVSMVAMVPFMLTNLLLIAVRLPMMLVTSPSIASNVGFSTIVRIADASSLPIASSSPSAGLKAITL